MILEMLFFTIVINIGWLYFINKLDKNYEMFRALSRMMLLILYCVICFIIADIYSTSGMALFIVFAFVILALIFFYSKIRERILIKSICKADKLYDSKEYMNAISEYSFVLKLINESRMSILYNEIEKKISRELFFSFEDKKGKMLIDNIEHHLFIMKNNNLKKNVLKKMLEAEKLAENKEEISAINIYLKLQKERSVRKLKSLEEIINFKIGKFHYTIYEKNDDIEMFDKAKQYLYLAEGKTYQKYPDLYYEIIMYLMMIIKSGSKEIIYDNLLKSLWCCDFIDEEKSKELTGLFKEYERYKPKKVSIIPPHNDFRELM
jgi:hypothetical protein